MYINNPRIPKPAIGGWAAPYDKKIADVNAPRTNRTDAEVHRARAAYYGNITFIDHQIGRVLYELRQHDRETLANTLILFTSDHGDMMGDHYHWRKTTPTKAQPAFPS